MQVRSSQRASWYGAAKGLTAFYKETELSRNEKVANMQARLPPPPFPT